MLGLSAACESKVVQARQQQPDLLSTSVDGPVVAPGGDGESGALRELQEPGIVVRADRIVDAFQNPRARGAEREGVGHDEPAGPRSLANLRQRRTVGSLSRSSAVLGLSPMTMAGFRVLSHTR